MRCEEFLRSVGCSHATHEPREWECTSQCQDKGGAWVSPLAWVCFFGLGQCSSDFEWFGACSRLSHLTGPSRLEECELRGAVGRSLQVATLVPYSKMIYCVLGLMSCLAPHSHTAHYRLHTHNGTNDKAFSVFLLTEVRTFSGNCLTSAKWSVSHRTGSHGVNFFNDC